MKVVHEGGPWTRSRWWSMDWGSVLCIYPLLNANTHIDPDMMQLVGNHAMTAYQLFRGVSSMSV